MAQKSGNLLIKNILITIDQLFPPTSTENNSIYFFITQTQERKINTQLL